MTVSQNTSYFKEERSITYEKLNEFYKYVKYKEVADALLEIDSIEIAQLNQVIYFLQENESLFKTEIDHLNNQVQNKNSQINNREDVILLLRQSIAKEQRVKWNYGLWGAVCGIAIGTLIVLNL